MLKKIFFKSLRSCSFMLISCILLSTWSLLGQSGADSVKIWVGTWGTAPQLVEPGNVPPSPGLGNNSIRQIVRVSIGGDSLRVKFSNVFSNTSVTMKAVKIAVSAGGNAIYDSTSKKLTFGGNPEIIMDSGEVAISDPIAFDLQPRMTLAITIYFGPTSATITGHPGSRTTSYLKAGNDTSVTNFSGAVTTDHWYIINGIDVLKPPTFSCVSVIGNSITDGRGTTTNMQNRWTDILSERLLANSATEQIGVLNMGLGGNCVLKFCLGPAAIDRFERDVLNQSGISAAVIFEGVNDIGGVKTLPDVANVANGLIEAYKMMIDSAHARNFMIYGATIMPFKGNGYYNTYSESCRIKVNDWIRNSGRFDAVIDFDMITRNPLDIASLGIASYQTDGLHPTAEGYKTMGDSIDLTLFEGLDTIRPVIDTTGNETLWLETECAVIGENWKLVRDPQTSNEGYVTIESGLNNTSTASNLDLDAIFVQFTVTKDTTYTVYARLNCPGTDDDSFWAHMDSDGFEAYDGLTTSGWEWKVLNSFDLTAGDHNFIITYREDGARLDKICITTDTIAPSGIGKSADKVCLPDTVTIIPVDGLIESLGGSDTYILGQNYPNPFNDNTTILFEIPGNAYVSLKVFSLLGEEIAELAGKEYTSGWHTIEFDAKDLSKGIYFYTIKADKYFASRKMIIQAD